ncbi:MAG: DNA helicase, partial [Clostridia bacterium]|nr:DNA helicase [Clostridia bacterium]
YLQTVLEIYSAIERIASKHTLSRSFCSGGKINYKRRREFLAELYALHEKCASAFLDYNADAFNGMCIRASNGYTLPVLEGYMKAAESFFTALDSFYEATHADRDKLVAEDILDYYSTKASSLIDNIDMLPNWCMYKDTTRKLSSLGLNFIADELEGGRLKGENILAGFEKNVYKNFLEINIPADPNLSHMTVGTLEESIEKFRLACDEYGKLTRNKLREILISRLPKAGSEGTLSLELSAFARFAKSNLRGTGLRAMFSEIPTLSAVVSPCLLMSPIAVAQYLAPVANSFDLVIFDEASQMSTAEAVGSIARAKAAIVVGDPKQLPPTSFFNSQYIDEDNLENEDLESVLDDCLALGMPERHLEFHYRSKHESLIAFSNSMYYDNRLCTFPSPDSLESKVKLVEVDGSYDRGFTKRNRKEAEALVKEVIRRLSDPVLSRSSMGVVTFSSAQQEDIDRLLTKAIQQKKLESVAYEREEPLFVKNLENVQGDERDVILFSVCYGPDQTGRVSLNFGPLNQAGGWRRLNVAVSRAREEMLVFSTMKANMINLQKTSSKGVAGLKAFLEFAERGRTTLAVRSDTVRSGASIGKFIAQEIAGYGYECRYNVGASDFKVDVAVIDPNNKHRFVLGIICDGTDKFSVKDRNVLQMQT